jgi:hypothetical protein
MMVFHDAVLVSLGSCWAPDFLDGTWDGIGEWQSRRGWHFRAGGPAAGGYVFGKPEPWPRGYMPTQPFDCLKPGTQHLILSLCTTRTDQALQAALEILRAEMNPFVIAACAWSLGQRRMKEAIPGLQRLLEHGSFVVRVYAAEALWTINGNQGEVLPALLGVISF